MHKTIRVWGISTSSIKISRREIRTQREFRRELLDGKYRLRGVEWRTYKREVEERHGTTRGKRPG